MGAPFSGVRLFHPSKSSLSMYFQVMKIDPKYAFSLPKNKKFTRCIFVLFLCRNSPESSPVHHLVNRQSSKEAESREEEPSEPSTLELLDTTHLLLYSTDVS